MSQWTVEAIPDLQGKVVVVTGANSGLGFETTRALARKNAHIVMAVRSLDKARVVRDAIINELPHASLELAQLDLASLASIRDFAASFRDTHKRLDLHFNNAGVMAIPRYESVDGFELQFGTNHLGHFALTGLLLPTLLSTPQSRIITTTSSARLFGRINLDDLQGKRSYTRWGAYGQSKLANLLFATELQRRLTSVAADTLSVAAHPGYAHTELQSTSATTTGSSVEGFFYSTFGPMMSQSASMGALPQLYAATAPNIHGGELIGPDGLFGMRGYPKEVRKLRRDTDKEVALRLWDVSIELTGVDYSALRELPGRVEKHVS